MSDEEVSAELDLHKAAAYDAFRESTDGFGLPSFPEFLTLLRIQQNWDGPLFISPDHFYWLADNCDRGSQVIVSLSRKLNHPAATLIVSGVRDEGLSVPLNLYAIDPYKQTTGQRLPRGLQARVHRREVVGNEVTFTN